MDWTVLKDLKSRDVGQMVDWQVVRALNEVAELHHEIQHRLNEIEAVPGWEGMMSPGLLCAYHDALEGFHSDELLPLLRRLLERHDELVDAEDDTIGQATRDYYASLGVKTTP